MKFFKIIDLLVSITLFIVFLVLSLVCLNETFIYGYFIVGGWQIISMVIHRIAGWFTNRSSRRSKYFLVVLIVILMGLLTFLIPVFGLIFYILLFAAPFMALYYILICWFEIDFLRKRELIHLK